MNLNKTRIVRIVIITCLVLIVLILGQRLYEKYFTEKSLEKILMQTDYVDNVSVKREGNQIKIDVVLYNVDNIKKTYISLHEIIAKHLKNDFFSVEIQNKPSKSIEHLYYNDIQYVIHEAIQTGKFIDMKTILDKFDDEYDIDIKVFLDSKNLYLQMQNDKCALYKIIERN